MVALTVGASGCTYTVRLLSRPDNAIVTLPDGRVTATPDTVTFRVGRPQLVRVEARGYMPLVVDMRRTEGRPGRMVEAGLTQRGREVTFLLEPERPPLGLELTP